MSSLSRSICKPEITRRVLGSRGVFETAHGIGENIRGRTLGAIDDVTSSGTNESKSRHTALADSGRMKAETGMAHIYGYADPDVYRGELGRVSNQTGTSGSGHTTGTGPGRGYVGAGEDDYHGRSNGVDGGADGYGPGDGKNRPSGQGFENHQPGPASDHNGWGGSPPNLTSQKVGSEVGFRPRHVLQNTHPYSNLAEDDARFPS